ncbi:MAG: hypothetical protein OXU66_01055 [Gammaproteobacteria bacterium]|nr:hypothetical protein [Gammaproteobacteria bacterium]MDD9957504.1 hypothetical protein [Gammaproteobacteria bacterium]
MNWGISGAVALLLLLNACSDTRLATSEAFIDAFYAFDQYQLEPFLANAPESFPVIIYYQGWAEGGNYKVLDRRPCVFTAADTVECSITVEDDPILALGIDFKVTDTFTITFNNSEIAAIETSSDDPDIYFIARDWVRENRAELIATPCEGFFNGGPTPGDCARAMASGYAEFAASDDFSAQ